MPTVALPSLLKSPRPLVALIVAVLAAGCRGPAAAPVATNAPVATSAPIATGAPVATSPASGPAAVPPRWVKPTDFDFQALLGDPPADDSDAHRGELDQLLSLQADRTPAQVARCRAEEVVDVYAFADVLGPWFAERDLPVTAALMRQVQVDAKAASDAAKGRWKRVRPPLVDPRIKPCVKLEPSPAYPSGHANRGALWAALLADAVPDKAVALAARGKQIGTNRLIGGMHWPTDVAAGRVLGTEIACRLLADPSFRAEWERAKAEMAAHRR